MSKNTINHVCYDLVVIGGGIHGCGIAADAAGRGLKVLLCEQDDLAQYTSSASSKMIHGGLRYLEQKDFGLVRSSLHERELLLRRAPHLVEPLRFILPYRSHLRAAWLIRAGLYLYDFLAGSQAHAASKKLLINPAQSPLQSDIVRGFEYTDCRTDDARLVVLNAMLAAEHSATVLTRTRFISAQRAVNTWQVQLEGQQGGYQIQAKALVNAAGPWVNQVIQDRLNLRSPVALRYVQGSHIVVSKLYAESQAYILQNEDQRVVFVIPYLNDFSLIGTTDYEPTGDPAQAEMSDEERDYLLKSVNQYFKKQLDTSDVIYSFAGIRVLVKDQAAQLSQNSRDYLIHLDQSSCELKSTALPLISIFGGKLTTYRRLSAQVVDKLRPYFPYMGGSWTAGAPLAGAEAFISHAQLVQSLMNEVEDLPLIIAKRWSVAYGTRVWRLLGQCRNYAEFGEDFGAGLHALEVKYLIRHEWAQTVEDVLWRRTHLGIFLSEDQVSKLRHYIDQKFDQTFDEQSDHHFNQS